MYKILPRSLSRSEKSLANFTSIYRKVAKNQQYHNRPTTSQTARNHPPDAPESKEKTAKTTPSASKRSLSFLRRSLFPETKGTVHIMMFSTSSTKYFYASTLNRAKDCAPSKKKYFKNSRALDLYKQALEQCTKIKFEKHRIQRKMGGSVSWTPEPLRTSHVIEIIAPTKSTKAKDAPAPEPKPKKAVRLHPKKSISMEEMKVMVQQKKATRAAKKKTFQIVYPKHIIKYKLGLQKPYQVEKSMAKKVTQQVSSAEPEEESAKPVPKQEINTVEVMPVRKGRNSNLGAVMAASRNRREKSDSLVTEVDEAIKHLISQHPAMKKATESAKMSINKKYNIILLKSQAKVRLQMKPREATPETSEDLEVSTLAEEEPKSDIQKKLDADTNIVQHPIHTNLDRADVELVFKYPKRLLSEKNETFDIEEICLKTKDSYIIYTDEIADVIKKMSLDKKAVKHEEPAEEKITQNSLPKKPVVKQRLKEIMRNKNQEQSPKPSNQTSGKSAQTLIDYIKMLNELKDQTSMERSSIKKPFVKTPSMIQKIEMNKVNITEENRDSKQGKTEESMNQEDENKGQTVVGDTSYKKPLYEKLLAQGRTQKHISNEMKKILTLNETKNAIQTRLPQNANAKPTSKYLLENYKPERNIDQQTKGTPVPKKEAEVGKKDSKFKNIMNQYIVKSTPALHEASASKNKEDASKMSEFKRRTTDLEQTSKKYEPKPPKPVEDTIKTTPRNQHSFSKDKLNFRNIKEEPKPKTPPPVEGASVCKIYSSKRKSTDLKLTSGDPEHKPTKPVKQHSFSKVKLNSGITKEEPEQKNPPPVEERASVCKIYEPKRKSTDLKLTSRDPEQKPLKLVNQHGFVKNKLNSGITKEEPEQKHPPPVEERASVCKIYETKKKSTDLKLTSEDPEHKPPKLVQRHSFSKDKLNSRITKEELEQKIPPPVEEGASAFKIYESKRKPTDLKLSSEDPQHEPPKLVEDTINPIPKKQQSFSKDKLNSRITKEELEQKIPPQVEEAASVSKRKSTDLKLTSVDPEHKPPKLVEDTINKIPKTQHSFSKDKLNSGITKEEPKPKTPQPVVEKPRDENIPYQDQLKNLLEPANEYFERLREAGQIKNVAALETGKTQESATKKVEESSTGKDSCLLLVKEPSQGDEDYDVIQIELRKKSNRLDKLSKPIDNTEIDRHTLPSNRPTIRHEKPPQTPPTKNINDKKDKPAGKSDIILPPSRPNDSPKLSNRLDQHKTLETSGLEDEEVIKPRKEMENLDEVVFKHNPRTREALDADYTPETFPNQQHFKNWLSVLKRIEELEIEYKDGSDSKLVRLAEEMNIIEKNLKTNSPDPTDNPKSQPDLSKKGRKTLHALEETKTKLDVKMHPNWLQNTHVEQTKVTAIQEKDKGIIAHPQMMEKMGEEMKTRPLQKMDYEYSSKNMKVEDQPTKSTDEGKEEKQKNVSNTASLTYSGTKLSKKKTRNEKPHNGTIVKTEDAENVVTNKDNAVGKEKHRAKSEDGVLRMYLVDGNESALKKSRSSDKVDPNKSTVQPLWKQNFQPLDVPSKKLSTNQKSIAGKLVKSKKLVEKPKFRRNYVSDVTKKSMSTGNETKEGTVPSKAQSLEQLNKVSRPPGCFTVPKKAPVSPTLKYEPKSEPKEQTKPKSLEQLNKASRPPDCFSDYLKKAKETKAKSSTIKDAFQNKTKDKLAETLSSLSTKQHTDMSSKPKGTKSKTATPEIGKKIEERPTSSRNDSQNLTSDNKLVCSNVKSNDISPLKPPTNPQPSTKPLKEQKKEDQTKKAVPRHKEKSEELLKMKSDHSKTEEKPQDKPTATGKKQKVILKLSRFSNFPTPTSEKKDTAPKTKPKEDTTKTNKSSKHQAQIKEILSNGPKALLDHKMVFKEKLHNDRLQRIMDKYRADEDKFEEPSYHKMDLAEAELLSQKMYKEKALEEFKKNMVSIGEEPKTDTEELKSKSCSSYENKMRVNYLLKDKATKLKMIARGKSSTKYLLENQVNDMRRKKKLRGMGTKKSNMFKVTFKNRRSSKKYLLDYQLAANFLISLNNELEKTLPTDPKKQGNKPTSSKYLLEEKIPEGNIPITARISRILPRLKTVKKQSETTKILDTDLSSIFPDEPQWLNNRDARDMAEIREIFHLRDKLMKFNKKLVEPNLNEFLVTDLEERKKEERYKKMFADFEKSRPDVPTAKLTREKELPEYPREQKKANENAVKKHCDKLCTPPKTIAQAFSQPRDDITTLTKSFSNSILSVPKKQMFDNNQNLKISFITVRSPGRSSKSEHFLPALMKDEKKSETDQDLERKKAILAFRHEFLKKLKKEFDFLSENQTPGNFQKVCKHYEKVLRDNTETYDNKSVVNFPMIEEKPKKKDQDVGLSPDAVPKNSTESLIKKLSGQESDENKNKGPKIPEEPKIDPKKK